MTDTKLPWFVGVDGLAALRDSSNFIVLDYETTILPGFATNPDQHVVLACWLVVTPDGIQRKYRFGDEYTQDALAADIAKADFVVAQNAKFEAQWLQRSGIELRDVLFYCTQVGEWVILGNNPKKLSLHLDDMAKRRLGRGKESLGNRLIKDWGVCPSITPRSWLLKYCAEDVELTYEIFLQQRKELTALDLWHIILARMLTVPVLADIELQGLELDCDEVSKEYTRQLGVRESAALALDEVTGGINLNSRPQLASLLYDKLGFQEARDHKGDIIVTKGGARATSEDVLQSLVAETEDQKVFLQRYKEYSKANTLLSKTLTFLSKVCEHQGGKFYGRIIQGRTGTHRLASGGQGVVFPGDKAETKIQLQNIPREYKKLFTAHHPEYLIREDDGAQLEFRVAAELGNEPVALREIEDGVDIHSFTREVMRKENHPDFTGKNDKEARQIAKAHTFQPLFGGRGQLAAENAYADAWAKKYSNLTREQDSWCMQVAASKMLITPYGMRYYWPHIKMYQSGRVDKRSEIYNYPIQGFATAEIIPIALVHYWHRIRNLRVEICNTVHDSIISRVHKDDNEALDAIAKQAMTYDVYTFLEQVYGYRMTVPLGTGTKTSKHWGTAKIEKVWDVWPDGRERYQEKD